MSGDLSCSTAMLISPAVEVELRYASGRCLIFKDENARMIAKPAVILYVEHNRMLLQTVRDVLEFAGWYVKPCSEEGYAVAYVESEQQHFDLLLFDHDFPKLSGLMLTERARRQPHRRKTPIILISLEDIAEKARRAGADAFLRKPNNLIELVETVRRLLAARGEGGA